MRRKSLVLLVLAALVSVSLACQLLTRQAVPDEAVTLVEATVAVQEVTAVPLPTIDTDATALAEEIIAQATQEAEALAAEQEQAEKAATAAAQAAEEMALTAEVEALATRQAADIFEDVTMLEKQGDIGSNAGMYYQVEDFEESWAQIGWYQWWTTGYQPTNFVIRAHTDWESASRTANWYDAGCGFVFRAKDEKNHYMIYLALDGYVYMKGYVDNTFRELGREYYGSIERVKGEADVLLAVDGAKITYYVDGKKVFQRENKMLQTGDLALTLVSGTNKDYGTRCSMSDIEIWELSQ